MFQHFWGGQHLSGADRNGTKTLCGLKAAKTNRRRFPLPSSLWELAQEHLQHRSCQSLQPLELSEWASALSPAGKCELNLPVPGVELWGSHLLHSCSPDVQWQMGAWTLLRVGTKILWEKPQFQSTHRAWSAAHTQKTWHNISITYLRFQGCHQQLEMSGCAELPWFDSFPLGHSQNPKGSEVITALEADPIIHLLSLCLRHTLLEILINST